MATTVTTDQKAVTVSGLRQAFIHYHGRNSAKKYGVQFPGGGSNVGTRLWDAESYTSTPTFGSTVGSSDFDEALPFQHKRCNVKDCEVVCYEGQSGFNEYGKNGDVYEEFINPYMYISDDENTYGVSAYPISSDWFPLVSLDDGTIPGKIYIPAYKMSVDDDGVAHSIAGVWPKWGSFSTHYKAAQLVGENYHAGPSWYDTWKQVMTAIEYASRDCQNGSGMQGFSGGLYTQTGCKTTEAVTSSNTIPVDKPSNLVVGQTVNICSGWITKDYVDYRTITAIDEDESTITISGDAVTLDSDLTVYNMDWKCGSTLSVSGDTGQAVKSNKYSMKYRGIEDMWGGSAEDICDLRLKLDDDETANPTAFYYCPDPRDAGYTDDVNASYIKTGLNHPGSEGYITSFTQVPDYPSVRVPTAVGGTSTTYYADYTWRYANATTTRSVRSGYSWFNGAGLGVSYRNCNHAASYSSRLYCARLFFTR